MKYIRTKNGIYEVKTKRVFNHIKEYRLGDTIEELCDEVVLIDKKHKKPKWLLDSPKEIKDIFDNNIPFNKRIKNKTITIMFGIWTSKGLIYVAKLDSEGKLVLI